LDCAIWQILSQEASDRRRFSQKDLALQCGWTRPTVASCTVLQREGRMSNADLPSACLSPSACHRRVQRLEAEGIIRELCRAAGPRVWASRPPCSSRSRLSGQADEVLDAFERRCARIPDVLECHLMAGIAGLPAEDSPCAIPRISPASTAST
jgi:hypothetical protein